MPKPEPPITELPVHVSAEWGKYAERLWRVYDRIPPVSCGGRARCCTLLPEMSLVEAVSAVYSILEMPRALRSQVLHNMAEYFLLNPVRIMKCPFLRDGLCLIYDHRFLGCRTYGLWPEEYYTRMADANREAKKRVRMAWAEAGVAIPDAIVNFSVPYCNRVRVAKGHKRPSGKTLLKLGVKVDEISSDMNDALRQQFTNSFFMDLSFWLAANAAGARTVVQMKLEAVRQWVSSGGGGDESGKVARLSDALCNKFSAA